MDDLYHQDILDHYQHPDNFGKLDHPDLTIHESNASCGDSFTFYLKVKPHKTLPLNKGESEGVVIDTISFTGTGCAISTAACSLLTSKIKGQPVSVLKTLNLDYMQNLLGVQIGAARLKCLLLPAKALSQLARP